MVIPTLLFALCGTAPVLDGDGRPVLSGPEQVHLSADGRFRVHFTTSGADALVVTDDVDPTDGVPDTVDWVEEGAGRMYDVFVGEDGWPVPPSDEGVGGDDRIDIYLRDLAGNGCTHDARLPSGDLASYIEVAPARATTGKLPFESIAGHELHHVLEFALTDRMPNWIAEATASYAQYLVFADGATLDALRSLLWRLRLGLPQRALDSVGDDYEYAGLVWVKYLVDKNGSDRRKLLALWQALASAGDVDAGHDAFVAAHLGLASFDDAAADYAVWNWFACGNDDGRHYTASVGCDMGLVASTSVAPLPASGTSVAIGRRGSAYLLLPPDCASDGVDVTLTPTGAMRFQVIEEVTGGDSPVLAADGVAGADTRFSVSGWNQYRRLAVVGTSLGAAPASFDYAVSPHGELGATLPASAELALGPPALTLQAGGSAPVAVSARLGRCAGVTVTSVTWRSSDPAVATAEDGLVVAHAPGSAVLEAMVGSATSDPLQVTVTAAPDTGGCAVGRGRAPALLPIFLILLGFRMRRK